MRVLLLVLLATAASAAEPQRPKVAVLDFEANGTSAELATAATGLAANELQSFGAFEVVTSDMVRSVLALERQKQLLGCGDDEASCLTELAGALGADWLVTGRVSRVGELFTLDLSLIDARKARRESSITETARSEAELLGKIAAAVSRVMAPLLSTTEASVLLTVGEKGATVRVDRTVVGTTPLEGRLQVSPGTHLLEVEKEGFITFRRQLKLGPDEVVEQNVTLVPSPDFIAQYEARESKLRLGAWIASGVAVLGLAGVGYFQYEADRLYGPATRDGTFLFHRAELTDGVAEATDREHWSKASQLKAQIDRNQTLSWVSGGIGAAAGLGAAALWIIGDDPGRYSRFKSVQVGAGPSMGGGFSVSLGGEF